MQRAEIDLEQHRYDHQPDQHGDRDVDLGDRHAAEHVKRRGQQAAEHDADDDAERHPQRQVALERAKRRPRAARRGFGDRAHATP